MLRGVKGRAPGSWKTMVTMSFPMCRFRRSCARGEGGADRCGYRRGLRSPLVPESTGPSLQLAPPGVAQDEPAGGRQGPGEEGLKA